MSLFARQMLEALQKWELEPVEHMFKYTGEDEKQIQKEMETLIAFRDKCAAFMPVLKALLASCMFQNTCAKSLLETVEDSYFLVFGVWVETADSKDLKRIR